MNRPVPFRPSFSACRPPLSAPLSCGSFVSSEVTAARLLAEVANRAQHGGPGSQRRGCIMHTLGSPPLMVLGLFKVAQPLKTAFSEFPQNSQGRSLTLSVCLSPLRPLRSTPGWRSASVLTSRSSGERRHHPQQTMFPSANVL